MDYSFLVGVHFCDDVSASKMGLSTFTASPSKFCHLGFLTLEIWLLCANLSDNTLPELLTKSESFQVGGGGMPELCFSDNDFDRIPDCRYVVAFSIYLFVCSCLCYFLDLAKSPFAHMI